MKSETVHIGVDVSKKKLDIYVPARKEGLRPETREVGNSIDGFRDLRDLARKSGATVCVEPTGGYEMELVAFMHKFGVPVAYADALRVRQFAKAEGCLSKNDTVDAALISRFADKIGVRTLEPADMDAVELRRNVKFRLTMMDLRTALICRLETEIDADIRSMMKEQIGRLDRMVDKMERSSVEMVARNEKMNVLLERFTKVGGVGKLTAISILAGLPEIGELSDEKLNRLAGISPEQRQSGTKEWRRRIWGGRKDVRNALYMAAMASIQWNATLGAYYHKKRAEGHPHKWALVPTMRKMLSLLNRIARDPNFTPSPEPESTRKNAKAGRNKKTA